MGLKRTAIIVAVTAVALNVLPCFLRPSLPKVIDGYAAPGWEKVTEVFKSQVDSGLEKGGGFAAWYKGELVFDYVGGYADVETERPWRRDLLTIIFSSTKGVSAITAAVLVERGLLDYDELVVKYWPEFGQNGKEKVTVRTLFGHSAGLAAIDQPLHMKDIAENPEKVSRALAKQKPAWEPGTGHGYHALSIAMYINELVRRIDPKHRSLKQFFREEIAVPFDIETFIGLPREEYHRCTHTYEASMWSAIESGNWAFFPLLVQMAMGSTDSLFMKAIINPSGVIMGNRLNDPEQRDIPLGSSHGHATVSGLAKLYGILGNGGSYKGKKLLSMKTIRDMMKPVSGGIDKVLNLNLTFAAAVNIFENPLGEPTFGTPGAGGQLGIADPQHHLGWAYVTNHMKHSIPDKDIRSIKLQQAVYDVIKEMERKQSGR